MTKTMRAFGLGVGVLCLAGCKKQVPEDIVQKTMSNVLRSHASGMVSAMCGGSAKGLSVPNIRVTKRGPNNTGTAHVKGSPTFFSGKASQCEGDIEFTYSFTQKTTGPSRRRKTTTTWYLDRMKLVAVQTPGVDFKPFEEGPEGDDDDDDSE